MKRDISYWFRAVSLGSIACVFLYTLLGFMLVRMHAGFITAEMQIFTHFHMIPVVLPNDVHIRSTRHLVESALFFGVTLGLFIATIASILSIPLWRRSRGGAGIGYGTLIYASLAFIACILGYSKEMPWISILTAMVSPVFFFLPWWAVTRHARPSKGQTRQWPLFFIIIILPTTMLMPALNYTRLRDGMIDTPVLDWLSRFYYDHTLLAAHVIKPIKYRTQNIIAIPPGTKSIAYSPSGTLWLRTDKPCSRTGIAFAVSKRRLGCPHIKAESNTALNKGNELIERASSLFDLNRPMRRSIGIFIRGPVLVVPLFLLVWLSITLSRLSMSRRILVTIMVLVYYMCFIPSLHNVYVIHKLASNPGIIHDYARSKGRIKKYTCLVTYPGRLSKSELKRLANDKSAGIRLNALIEMGRREDTGFVPRLIQATKDPQLNVRTKACEALGLIGGKDALNALYTLLKTENNWYVRDYAYRALCRIHPIAAIMGETHCLLWQQEILDAQHKGTELPPVLG